jgi:hypothetical protein
MQMMNPSYSPNAQAPQTGAGYGAVPQLGASSGGYSGTGAPTNGGPNILGGGMYQGAPINVNQNAFNNPVGVQAGQALSGLLPNFIGGTTSGVNAATAAGGNASGYNAGIAGQLGLAQQYQQMAAGNGPSAASVQAQQQGQQNLAATESMLGSARGSGNPAAAQQQAANAQTSGQQQVAQNAVAGRTQEELGAMGAASGLYGQIGSQGLQEQGMGQSLNQFNAGQQNQIGLANQQNTSQQYNNYLQSLQGINQQQQQGQIAGQQLAAQTQLGQEQIQANAYNNAANQNSKLTGSVLSGGSGLAGMFV